MLFRDMGAAGGLALFKKRGKEYMAEIGRRGFDSLVNRWFNGSREEATAWLRKQGWERQVERMVGEKLDKQIADGATIACEEIPVVLDADSDPFYKEAEYWQNRVTSGRNGKRR